MSSFMDFDTMAQLTLKYYFEDLTPTQKARYTAAFKQLIQSLYLKRLKPGTHCVMTVLGVSDRMRSREGGRLVPKARVSTLLKSDSIEFEVDYLLKQHLDGTWRSYDIVLDGVGTVRNYRRPFYRLMREQGFEALMDKINKRIEKYRTGLKKK